MVVGWNIYFVDNVGFLFRSVLYLMMVVLHLTAVFYDVIFVGFYYGFFFYKCWLGLLPIVRWWWGSGVLEDIEVGGWRGWCKSHL